MSSNKLSLRTTATLLYCAGLHFPLNTQTMVPLVGQDIWDAFVAEIEKQNTGEVSTLTSLNSDDLVKYLRFTLPAEDLCAKCIRVGRQNGV